MANLTIQEVETVQRALGLLEGVSYGVDKQYAAPLLDAVEMLDSVLGVGDDDAAN